MRETIAELIVRARVRVLCALNLKRNMVDWLHFTGSVSINVYKQTTNDEINSEELPTNVQ